MKKLISLKTLFALFLVVWFAYGVWESRNYAFLAKVFPFYVSLVLLVFAIVNIVLETRKQVTKAMDMEEQSPGADLNVQWDMPMQEVWKRFRFFIALILILYACIYLVGYPVAMCLFIGLFYKYVGKASVTVSVVAGCCGLAFLALASKVLGMDWPKGLIEFPWPLG